MKVYLISDTHFNHAKIATYCARPADFTERLIKNWHQVIKPEDCVIHLGDVFIGPTEGWYSVYPQLTGRKTLIRGNHDRQRSIGWWMTHGFDFACDGLRFRNCWLTHEPASVLPSDTLLNLHGHLHNIWHGFLPDGGENNGTITKLCEPWQRLFSVEYTNYMPVDFDNFVNKPERYQATGLKK